MNPLALMSLRKQPPAPPAPLSSRHLKNIEFGASLVAEAAVMMKHRLAEHTLANLAGRLSESFFKRTFLLWYRTSSNSRNFLIRADRALCRLGLRVLRRALHSWQDRWVWSRVIENLATLAIKRCWAKMQCMALDEWKDLLQRRKLVLVKTRRGSMACRRIYIHKWRMSSRISRVREVQLARLIGRKIANLLRVSFAAIVAQHHAEKGLYNIDRLVRKTAILSGAVILRAWREHIEFNIHMEKSGCAVQRRWDTVGLRGVMREWLLVHAFTRIASHASLVIAQKVFVCALRQSFTAWSDVHLVNTVMRNAGKRIVWKGGLKLAGKAWARWVEARTVSRRLAYCHQIIRAKYQLRECTVRHFQAWRLLWEDSRRLACVDRKFIRFARLWCSAVLCAWHFAARRSRKFNLWHAATDTRLKRIWLRNCFAAWEERSLEYWRSWRKCEKLKSRLNAAAVSVHLVSWKEKMRAAGMVSLFAAKINTRVLANVFQEWCILKEREIARAGRVESGMLRMAIKREYYTTMACTDLWYAKIACRKRVEQMVKSSTDKIHAATIDKYLAAWMRRQDGVVMRRGRLSQNVRRHQMRLKHKGLWCFNLNYQEERAFSHRFRCIQLRLAWNASSAVFNSWRELCAINQVKGKLYFGLVERGNHKAKAVWFAEWSWWLQNRRRRQHKVHKALLMNAPRYVASWVLSTWADKHSRTMHFERLVLSRSARCSQGALNVWYDNVKDGLLQSSCISKVRHRLDYKTLAFHLELWHMQSRWSMFAYLTVSRADIASSKGQLQRAIETWSHTVILNAKKRSSLKIFLQGMTTRGKAALFSAWSTIVNDKQTRVMNYLLRRGICSSEKARSVTFHGWRSVVSVHKLCAMRLKTVYARLLQSEIRASLTRWHECTYDHALLVRKCVHLTFATRQRILQRGFRILRRNAPSSQAVLKVAMTRWTKVSRSLLTVCLQQWIQEMGWVRRKRNVISSWTSRSSSQQLCNTLAIWTTLQRSVKRLNRQVDVWDRRSVASFFDAWVDFAVHRKDCRTRAWLMCLRSDRKIVNMVFLFWANLASMHRTRRIKMIKMHERLDSKRTHHVWMVMVEGVALLRRRRLLHVKTAAAVERCRLSSATAKLFDTTRSALRRRRMFSILVQRRHLKTAQLAWGAWLMRMEVVYSPSNVIVWAWIVSLHASSKTLTLASISQSKKRMQAAYKMAIEMD